MVTERTVTGGGKITISDGPAQNKNEYQCKVISVWRETLDTPRRNVVSFVRVDLTDPQLEVFVQPSADPDGPDGPAEASLALPFELLQDPAIAVAINANAFSRLAGHKKTPWYVGQAVELEGLVVADGVVRSSDDAERLPLWFDEQGRPHLGHPSQTDKVVQAVADWVTPLLMDNKLVAPKAKMTGKRP